MQIQNKCRKQHVQADAIKQQFTWLTAIYLELTKTNETYQG